MLSVTGILFQLIAETPRGWQLAFRSSRSITAANLFLRRQLALYIERGVKPRRIDPVTRIGLTLLSRFFNWRDALVVARPETMIRWHRAGWKLFWRLKSRPDRPPIPPRYSMFNQAISGNPLPKHLSKLGQFASYYNDVRVHSALSGNTPAEQRGRPSTRTADLQQFSWQAHCHGLFHTPIAA